ncbi:hypothetical protein [Candidatus Pelagibacter sp. Uisw_134_02]|uniref:hypothetical protein n=1 Tax=Candidatus Pelagibacter sp. Uisw_134_02 TaxID=3230990 RepID=UPI0039ECAAAD
MKKLFLFLFLTSCASPSSNYNTKNEVLNFDKNLTFNEFTELIITYSQINPYPNIDN